MMRAASVWIWVTLGAFAAFGFLSILRPMVSAAPGDVLITALSCNTSPEYVRLKNFGGAAQSLSGFHVQSDPAQDYDIGALVSSIGPSQTLEFQSGTGAADNPGAGIYRLTGSFIYRNSDPTDYARLLRSDATAHQVNCGSAPVTPSPTPSPSPTPYPGNGKLQIHHIDVEQGDAALIISPAGQFAMVDSGDHCSNTINYLNSFAITTIAYHFASHYHTDHIGCLNDMAGNGITVSVACYDRGSSFGTAEFSNYVATCGAKRQTLTKGQVITLDQGASTPVIVRVIDLNGAGVYNPSGTNENALSVVLRISYGCFDEVMGGDLPGLSPEPSVESAVGPQVGNVEVYKVHHHGSATSSSDSWLNSTTPEVGMISVATNPYGHPTADALARLHNRSVKTYWTNAGSGAGPDPSWDKVGETIVVMADPTAGQGYSVAGAGFTDGYTNDAEPDCDSDGVRNSDETPCGANSLNPASVPERTDTPGDDDGDGLANEPLPPGAEGYDCDGDGFTGSAEAAITTSDQDPCGNSGWPADLAGDDNRLSIADINSFIFPLGPDDGHGPFAYFNHTVPDASREDEERWNLDLASGEAVINIADVNALNPAANTPTSRPPMFGGQPAFFTNLGQCPYPP